MPQQLLREALQQAEQSAPDIRAAAFVHASRVLTVFDKPAATTLLERGLALAESLPTSERDILLPELAAAAAAVSPVRARKMRTKLDAATVWELPKDRISMTMMDHGHVSEAIEYLCDSASQGDFSFLAAAEVMAALRDDRDSQLRILRSAMSAVRSEASPHDAPFFPDLFNHYWKILPVPEATAFVREFADAIVRAPEQRWSQRFSAGEKEVRFSSGRACQIFQLLGPLRRLAPERVEDLIQQLPELAKAAELFPFGFYEDPMTPIETSSSSTAPETRLPGVEIEWDFDRLKWIPVAEWMSTCWEDMFKRALHEFEIDKGPGNPNLAPREVWPSTQSFRYLMHRAGRYEGAEAVRRLDRIPDADLRLLAKIEFLAALAGLELLGYSSRPPQAPHKLEDSSLGHLNLAALPVRWEGRDVLKEVRTETAEWDPERNAWASSKKVEISTFRPDRQLAETTCGPESIRHEYDESGRLKEVAITQGSQRQSPFVCRYDDRGRLARVAQDTGSSDVSWDSFDGAMSMGFAAWGSCSSVIWNVTPRGAEVSEAAAITIRYNDRNRAVELSYFASNGFPIFRMEQTWSAAGLLESQTIAPPTFDDIDAPQGQITFSYDSHGRCTELRMQLAEHIVREYFLYDDHDNMIERSSQRGHQRFEYTYDTHGNWIERVTWQCPADGMEYRPTTMERRTIRYASE